VWKRLYSTTRLLQGTQHNWVILLSQWSNSKYWLLLPYTNGTCCVVHLKYSSYYWCCSQQQHQGQCNPLASLKASSRNTIRSRRNSRPDRDRTRCWMMLLLAARYLDLPLTPPGTTFTVVAGDRWTMREKGRSICTREVCTRNEQASRR